MKMPSCSILFMITDASTSFRDGWSVRQTPFGESSVTGKAMDSWRFCFGVNMEIESVDALILRTCWTLPQFSVILFDLQNTSVKHTPCIS